MTSLIECICSKRAFTVSIAKTVPSTITLQFWRRVSGFCQLSELSSRIMDWHHIGRARTQAIGPPFAIVPCHRHRRSRIRAWIDRLFYGRPTVNTVLLWIAFLNLLPQKQ